VFEGVPIVLVQDGKTKEPALRVERG